jgi:trimeric autotransporter adhesin
MFKPYQRSGLKVGGVFALLCGLAFQLSTMAGCNGFFVDPTLSSITITPSTPALQNLDQTLQLTATGVFDDGSSKNVTASKGTTWSSSDPAAVTVSNTGMITLVSLTSGTSVTISASNGTASGTTTVCVGSSCTASNGVTISPSTTSYSLAVSQGLAITFTASANGSIVTATWSSNNVQVIQFADATTGIAQIVGQGTATITAQTSSGTGTLTITVGP